jgi:PleD family two-component response regulator
VWQNLCCYAVLISATMQVCSVWQDFCCYGTIKPNTKLFLVHLVMSSHDSVSMVFKCMLNGAADFLVEPIRKNELRNLWQHVWRKQHINVGSSVRLL